MRERDDDSRQRVAAIMQARKYHATGSLAPDDRTDTLHLESNVDLSYRCSNDARSMSLRYIINCPRGRKVDDDSKIGRRILATRPAKHELRSLRDGVLLAERLASLIDEHES